MKTRSISKILAVLLVVAMLVGVLPLNVLAGAIDFNTEALDDDYYKLISKKDWELAPGITETEIVLNNAEGSKRQVVHSVKVDMDNPYTKIIPGYKGMIPTPGNYGTEATSTQAKNAEALGYGNVVAATNAMLSWYDSAYYKANPHLIGEPLYYNILDGYYYENSQGAASFSRNYAVVVINYDYHPISGEKRPDDMPKVLMRSQTDPLTGWEQNAISVWEWLVKPDANGVPKTTYSVNHTSGHESRTFVGITAEGEIILSVSDGRQAPYSTGFNMYEMGEYMIKMGCIYVANCDGGGSTTFVSERPGEELKVNCSLSDGGERPTTNTLLVISTASASGEFERATLSTEYDYYTPGSSITFNALGTDAVGTKVDVPADVAWAIKEEGMGTIENGVFTSNGTPGMVTAQMLYNGKVVGERTITLSMPDKLSFSQPIVTIPYGTRAMIPVKATLDGLYEIGLSPADVIITSDNADLGVVDGLHFIGAATAPANNASAVTVTLKSDTDITASATLKLGDASVVLWDFEDGQADIDEWNSIVLRNPGEPHRDFYHKLSLADRTNGQVHNGDYSMRLETNGLSSADVHSKQYAYVRLGLKDQKISLENARSLGFWLYVPDDNIQCWVQGFYKYDTNGDGVPDTLAEVNLMNSENVYYNVDESGWHYLSMDLSDFEKVDLTYSNPFDADPSDGHNAGDKDEFFLVLIFHKSINNILWQTNGSINGPFTYYIDNITVDYSEAVEDREAPIFESVVMDNNGAKNNLNKHGVVTTTSNLLNIVANVAEATYRADGTGTKHTLYNYTGLNASTAKAYIDGVEVNCVYENGKISMADIAVADGYHRVKFEICDNAGNKSSVVRLVKVESGVKASTIQLVPADPSLVTKDRLDFGSIFWMNMEATNIETIQAVTMVIDLNSVNHWELDHMILADGFSATYSIDKETNTATVTFTRTGTNVYVGKAVLAQIPIRIIYFDTDMKIPGYTAETVWTKYNFWPHDLKVDVDMGVITYVDGYTSEVLNTFSNEAFRVNTEMYTDFQSMGSDPYFTEHGTTHAHTPVTLEDKAASCVNGYTGRTFCEACNSVVEWGITIPAVAEHSFELIDGKLTCTVGGELFNGTYIDGYTYYDGVAAMNGWIEVEGVKTYYYKNGVMLTGSHFFDGAMHTFDANGIYLPDYMFDGFYAIDDTVMYFVGNEYITGINRIDGVFYNFYKDGKAYDGIVNICGTDCLFEDGVSIPTEDVLYAGVCGEDAVFVLRADGEMEIGGSGIMSDYKTTGIVPWYPEHRMLIKTLVIGKDITVIGRISFYGAENLHKVTFEKGSKLQKINASAFGLNYNLTEIELPFGVEALGASVFFRCTNLKKVVMPFSVASMAPNVFQESTKVALYVPESSYAMQYAKQNGIPYHLYTGIVEQGISGDVQWTLYSNGDMVLGGNGAMADYDSGKTPWWNRRAMIKNVVVGKDVTYIGKFNFMMCSNLSSVVFEDDSALKTIGWGAFGYCTSLKEITIPASVEALDNYAFYNSTKLETVIMSETGAMKSIGAYAFLNDVSLKSVVLPNDVAFFGEYSFSNTGNVVLSVQQASEAHEYALSQNLACILRPAPAKAVASGTTGEVTWEFWSDGVLKITGAGAMADYEVKNTPWDAYRTRITTVEIGKNITYIGKFSFMMCSNLTAVVFESESALKTIGWGAFGYCNALVEVTIPASVETLDSYAFYNCPALETVMMSETGALKTIGMYAFWNDTALQSIILPNGVSSIGEYPFYNTGSVVLSVQQASYAHEYALSVKLACFLRPAPAKMIAGGTTGEVTWEFWSDGVLKITGAGAMADYEVKGTPWEAYRSRITTVVIGKDITYIGKFSFMMCSKLSSVVFEDGCALKTIGWGAFGYCNALTEVTIPVSVEVLDAYAFYNCAALTEVTFAEGSELKSIGMYAFWNDTNLSTVSGMPAGVVYGEGAFYNSGYTSA
ncbi:MAG: hypothetical protein E7645_00245 [Ruminococcaceae bacterium]|nr:hypothetical protein [Oscillospiraceae bacterium]